MGRLSGRPHPAAALVAAYALLAVAWAFTNPPFAAPDEAEHYLRAAGIASGSWLGKPAPDPNPALTPKQRAWTDQASRAVSLPAGRSPAGLDCFAHHRETPASCQLAGGRPPAGIAVTSVGTYQPLPYLLPALALGFASHATAEDRLARLAGLLPFLALIAGAVAASWERRRGPPSLAGPLLALTPMTLFVGASLTGSGLEIAGSIAFTAGLLALTRGEREPPRALWVLVGVAGTLAALSRTPAPLWLAGDLTLWAAWTGRRRVAALARRSPRPAAGTAATVLAAVALNRAWESAHGPSVHTALLPGYHSLTAGVRELTASLSELVGSFGYLEVSVPAWLVAAWALAAAVALAPALRRRAFALTAIVWLAAPAYLYAAVTRDTGFGLQGRHYLALYAAVALIGASSVRSRRAAAALGMLAGGGQLVGWWANSRRYAVGADGPLWFPSHALWSPPLGWWPWVAIVACACVLIVAATAPSPEGTNPA